MGSNLFSGVYTALVTPFHDDGSLDEEGYRALIEAQIEDGISGLVACGTTGEAATLSAEEHLRVVRLCVEAAKGRVPVLAGAGSNNTRVACELHQAVAELGVSGSLQVTPWYNKPCQEGLYQHFGAVAASHALPIMLYNVPGRTSIDLLPDTVSRLAHDFKNVVAIKEATGSIGRAQAILERTAETLPHFSVLSGEDAFILGLLSIGGHGVVSVISHLCVKELANMFDAYYANEKEKAQALSRKVSALQPMMFFKPNPVPVKQALALQGKIKAKVRLPLVALNEAEKAELKNQLSESGWLE